MRAKGVLFLLFFGMASEAAATELTWDHLPRLQRRGQQSCWVRFEWKGQSHCVSRTQWWKMLASPQVGLSSFADKVLVRKEFESQGVLKAVDLARPALSLRARVHRWLENCRERLSVAMEGGDRWGMFRALLLAEGASAEPLDLLRLSGWVHVSSLAGIHLYGALALVEVMMAWLLGRFLGSRSGWARGCADLTTWTLGLMVWALQGFRWGFIRPFAVFMLRRLALRTGFRWSTLGPLLLVIGLEFLLSTKLEFHGMWHYALAVGGGLIALETWQKRETRERGILEELRAHWVLSLGSWTPIAIVGVLSTGLCAPWTFLQSMLSVTACSMIWVPVAILCLVLYSVGLEYEATNVMESVQGFLYLGMEAFHNAFSSILLWTLEPVGLVVGLCLVMFLFFLRLMLRVRMHNLVWIGILFSLGF